VPYPPKPPTPQIVGAILKRAGFNRSQPDNRGPKEYTEGYQVRKAPGIPGAVEVTWRPSSLGLHPEGHRDRRTRWLQRYADAILADALYRSRFRVRLSEPDGKVTVYARSA
jgi:hypothetical protein